MQSQSWLQAHITCTSSQSEDVEQLLLESGAVSVTLSDAADQPLLENAPGEHPLWQAIQVTGLFPGDTDYEVLQTQLLLEMQQFFIPVHQLTMAYLAEQVWETAWMDRFKPMQFGDSLWIYPSHIEPELSDSVAVVRLDPGLAFGSGTHATTRLCLQWIESADLHGKAVVDYGCGSGVLAIAAALKGAKTVIAIDHDDQALQSTYENAKRNGVEGQITIAKRQDIEKLQADIVIANILAGVIVQLASDIVGLVKPAGTVVLSGILDDQKDMVMREYEKYCASTITGKSDDWVCIVMQKNYA